MRHSFKLNRSSKRYFYYLNFISGLSGFSKNQGNAASNILAHEVVDVRAKGNLA